MPFKVVTAFSSFKRAALMRQYRCLDCLRRPYAHVPVMSQEAICQLAEYDAIDTIHRHQSNLHFDVQGTR